jgi:hypothetical protein
VSFEDRGQGKKEQRGFSLFLIDFESTDSRSYCSFFFYNKTPQIKWEYEGMRKMITAQTHEMLTTKQIIFKTTLDQVFFLIIVDPATPVRLPPPKRGLLPPPLRPPPRTTRFESLSPKTRLVLDSREPTTMEEFLLLGFVVVGTISTSGGQGQEDSV